MGTRQKLMGHVSRSPHHAIGVALAASTCLVILGLAGCAADEPVGHSRTKTTKVTDTPTEKTTVTETHEKNTKLTPR